MCVFVQREKPKMFRSWFLNSLPRVIQSNAGKETTLFATATPFTPKEILSSETQFLFSFLFLKNGWSLRNVFWKEKGKREKRSES